MNDYDRTEQETNLERVSERIAGLVFDFCKGCKDGVFYMEELRDYVSAHLGGPIAPDSPGRVLRMLRQQNKIHYSVLSRSDSLYEVEIT